MLIISFICSAFRKNEQGEEWSFTKKSSFSGGSVKKAKGKWIQCNEDLPWITNARQFILIHSFLTLQGDLETKETGLQEKEVVIQKLQNNLSHREEELKVSNVSSQRKYQRYVVYCNGQTPLRTFCVPMMAGYSVIYGLSAVVLVQSWRYKMTLSSIVLSLLLLVSHKHIRISF